MNFNVINRSIHGLILTLKTRKGRALAAVICIVLGIALYAVEAARHEAQVQTEQNLAQARARAVAKARAAARHAPPVVIAPTSLTSPGRVQASTQAEDLFAPHSWYVPPPPPPAAVITAPVDVVPTAPPLPYTYVGDFQSPGDPPTYFLAKGDRVIDAHVGDKLEGSLLLEKVEAGQLIFNYTPLNIRQTLPVGVVQ